MKIDKTSIVDITSMEEIVRKNYGGQYANCDVRVSYRKKGKYPIMTISISREAYNIMGKPARIKILWKGVRLYFANSQDGYKVTLTNQNRVYIKASYNYRPVKEGDYELTYLETQNIYYIQEERK